MERGEHRWLGYAEARPGHFVALCSCGWRSHPSPSATEVGEEWDRHLDGSGAAAADR